MDKLIDNIKNSIGSIKQTTSDTIKTIKSKNNIDEMLSAMIQSKDAYNTIKNACENQLIKIPQFDKLIDTKIFLALLLIFESLYIIGEKQLNIKNYKPYLIFDNCEKIAFDKFNNNLYDKYNNIFNDTEYLNSTYDFFSYIDKNITDVIIEFGIELIKTQNIITAASSSMDILSKNFLKFFFQKINNDNSILINFSKERILKIKQFYLSNKIIDYCKIDRKILAYVTLYNLKLLYQCNIINFRKSINDIFYTIKNYSNQAINIVMQYPKETLGIGTGIGAVALFSTEWYQQLVDTFLQKYPIASTILGPILKNPKSSIFLASLGTYLLSLGFPKLAKLWNNEKDKKISETTNTERELSSDPKYIEIKMGEN